MIRKWDYCKCDFRRRPIRATICVNNAAMVRLTGCECTSARKIDMSRATNWSVLREYKKADIHPLTYVRRAKNGRDNRSTWNLRLKLTNGVARLGETFCRSPKIHHFSMLFFSLLSHLLPSFDKSSVMIQWILNQNNYFDKMSN